ncbi:MAG: threonylcarbamoyl-AMP synthase [Chloroflexi bacterium AL-W]|nr:threonylcarbamoyl-AMP synthase [Chloroflexi bacterium AL-N1]NOK75091.1 threonylcarbamoyl-AMP synthase [Chloroflexi bacterium AL-N5]NOK81878.1 threonylcarbamoyl-AMP synthase [Chloroflexi bacterium AL-W]NOK89724.1 threonylcarbamoyl-AMP synthase [Chloroflexi bacterium AL-N15]
MHFSIETQLLTVDSAHPDLHIIQMAAYTLLEGKLVAFPTETVYGLGANATDMQAVDRIFVAKGRPSSDPLIVHIATHEQLSQVAHAVPAIALELARVFWPGPLTLILPRHPSIPSNVTANRDTVAVRMPNHSVAQALLQVAAVPIVAPSANLFAHPSPTTAQHVFDDLHGRVDIILDGGPTPIGLESTVVSLIEDEPAILRPGGITVEALQKHLPSITFQARYLSVEESATGAPAPGMLARHYAPHAKLMLFTGNPQPVFRHMRQVAQELLAAGKRIGILTTDEEHDLFASLEVQLITLGSRADMAHVGQRLFAAMRELDKRGVDVMLVRELPSEGLGLTIRDRLLRATEGQVIHVDE